MAKQRLSVSVDSDLLDAGGESVARGGAKTLSAYVNDALRLKRDHDRRLAALAAFVASWEAEHGEITDEQMRTARSRMSERAVRIRRPARERPPTRRAVRR